MNDIVKVLLGSFLLAGCATTTAQRPGPKKTIEQVEKIASRKTIPTGTSVDLDAKRDKGVILVSAIEVASDRSAVFGTVTTVEKTTSTRTHGFAVLGGTVFGAGLVGELILGSTDGLNHDKVAAGQQQITTFVLLPSAIVFLADMLIPTTKTTVREIETKPLERWEGPSVPVANTLPKPAAVRDVAVKLAFKSSKKTSEWTVRTDANGKAVIPTAPIEYAAARCGDASISLGVGTTDEGTPSAPGVGLHGTSTPSFEFAAGPAGKSTLVFGPARTVADSCCAERKQTEEIPVCLDRCAKSINATKCVDSFSACSTRASKSVDPEYTLAYCRTLFDECLTSRRISSPILATCVDNCASLKAQEECR